MKTRVFSLVVAIFCSAATGHAATILATANGNMNDAATWGNDPAAPPVSGDTNVWNSNGRRITYGSATFYGGTFVLAAGLDLRPSDPTSNPAFQNFTFDGGTIINMRNQGGIFTFGSNTVTVTALGGTVSSDDGRSNRDVWFADGIWTGAGNLTFDNPAASDTPNVANVSTFRFETGANLSGYTGTMIGINKAIIELTTTIPIASFALDLRDASRYRNIGNNNIHVTGLSIGGSALLPGVYQVGNGSLTAGQEAFILSSGTITVIPEPRAALLGGLGLLALLRRRRG